MTEKRVNPSITCSQGGRPSAMFRMPDLALSGVGLVGPGA